MLESHKGLLLTLSKYKVENMQGERCCTLLYLGHIPKRLHRAGHIRPISFPCAFPVTSSRPIPSHHFCFVIFWFQFIISLVSSAADQVALALLRAEGY